MPRGSGGVSTHLIHGRRPEDRKGCAPYYRNGFVRYYFDPSW